MNRYLILAVGLLLIVAVGALAQEAPAPEPQQPPQPQPVPQPEPEKPKPDFSRSGSFGEPHAEPGDYVVTANGLVQVNFPDPPVAPAVPQCAQEFRVTAGASKANA